MRKSGRVIAVFEDKTTGAKKYNLVLDNSATEESCSIKIKDKNSIRIKDCSSCSGCGMGKKQKGLFAVSGNRITAINKSGKEICTGDIVQIQIEEKKTQHQAFASIFIPVIFAVIISFFLFSIFKTELAVISGVFLGLISGACLAVFIKKIAGDSALPEII